MKLTIFGLGFTAGFYARTRASKFAALTATKRAPPAEAEDALTLLPFDGARPELDARLLEALAASHAVLVSAGPNEAGDPVLNRLGAPIAANPNIKTVIYLSTIGVYGDQQGAWIDEDTPVSPSHARTRMRADVESQWLELGKNSGKKIFVLRLSGIYGPGRNVLEKLRDGSARRLVKPGQVFNRIHVEDIARALDACLFSDAPGGIYNVTDDEPAPPQDVIAFGAQLLNLPAPPEQDFATAQLTPMARSFYGENKRVGNARLKQLLGVPLAFPTYREGLAGLASAQGNPKTVKTPPGAV